MSVQTVEIWVAPSQRRKNKAAPTITARNPVSVDEMEQWCNSHSHIWLIGMQGKAVQVKVNGQVRRWKREPERIEIPIKYGMYEYATLTRRDWVRILIPEVASC